MLTPLPFSTRALGRYLLAAPLVVLLALSAAPARAQVAPTPVPPMKPAATQANTYFVDGKPTTKAIVEKLNPTDILSMNVVKDGTVLLTTKANANSPAVLALDKRFPVTPATPAQNSAVAAIKAYLAQTYPTAKLEMVGPAKDKPGRYQAFFMEGSQRLKLLFDDQGQPVQE